LNVPYLSVVEALSANTTWMQQVAKSDGAHPQADGYMEFSKLVLNWPQWWFRSSTK
jgi:lysophospholipase L1-like esterase